MEEYIDKVMEHKHALIFVGGIAAAIAGKKILESKAVKEGCKKCMKQCPVNAIYVEDDE